MYFVSWKMVNLLLRKIESCWWCRSCYVAVVCAVMILRWTDESGAGWQLHVTSVCFKRFGMDQMEQHCRAGKLSQGRIQETSRIFNLALMSTCGWMCLSLLYQCVHLWFLLVRFIVTRKEIFPWVETDQVRHQLASPVTASTLTSAANIPRVLTKSSGSTQNSPR